jgi:hypothetical protein
MRTPRTCLCLLPLLAAAPHAHAARPLPVQFTISGTEGFDGADGASLFLSKGNLSGTVTVIAPGGPFPCTLNFGSTLLHDRLNLTCTIGPDEMVTLSGTLNPRTGLGHGKFSETFFKEQGSYKAAASP